MHCWSVHIFDDCCEKAIDEGIKIKQEIAGDIRIESLIATKLLNFKK